MHKKRITPPRIRHFVLLGIGVLFAIALLTGSVHRIALGAVAALVIFSA